MNLFKLKNSAALVACLFVIHLSTGCAHPVPSSPTDDEVSVTVGRKIFNLQHVHCHDPATIQDNPLSQVDATKEPAAPTTTEAFPVTVNQGVFNITGFFFHPYRSDAFVSPTSDQTEEPSSMIIHDAAENVTPFPVSEEDISEMIPEENPQGLWDFLHDPDTATVQSTTDISISVNFPSLMRMEEPGLQRSPVTPSVPQDLFHLQASASTAPPDFAFANNATSFAGEAEARNILDSLKMLREKELVSNTLGDYLLPPEEVSEFQSTSTASFDPADHYIPMASTPTSIIVASAFVSISNETESSKRSDPSSSVVAKPIFHPSENIASTNLTPDPSAFRKTSVGALHSFHPPTDMPTAVRKFADVNPFPLNPAWPAKMGFHTYSFPEGPMARSFGDEGFTMHAKEKPRKRLTPEFPMGVSSYSVLHSFSPGVHPVQLRYRHPVFNHGHPRARYPHPHDNNHSIHRPFESAPRQSRKFAFSGISSTRDNFRFRVNWIDGI